MNTFLKLFIFINLILIQKIIFSNNYIEINKQGVLHKFVSFDIDTDHFVKNIFKNWEEDTFNVFESNKNSDAIAIDLGAWIGTTAIWLSKNFHHVIAVDADIISLDCLKKNLSASACENVTICTNPISNTSENVIFGPTSSKLNESGSTIKTVSTSVLDYSVKSLTFNQLIHDYVYKNENLKNRRISFIKCDIEGGEENIIEEILHFAFHNKCNVHLSFHLNYWKSKKIHDFEYLFPFFETNCPEKNICYYLERNPFASILFKPIDTDKALIKKNIPAVIIAYNQPSYIKNMVKQLENYTQDIIIVDNNSNFQPLLDYYDKEFKYTLLRQKNNYGYKVYLEDFIQNLVGNIYILTDPDLQFNQNLPNDFIDKLINLSFDFKSSRVGFALDIFNPNINVGTKVCNGINTLFEVENNYWQNRLTYLKDSSLVVYSAPIDTTFCLVNKKYIYPGMDLQNNNIRVAGNFTCTHLPWNKDYKKHFIEGELDAYMQGNNSTTWFKVVS